MRAPSFAIDPFWESPGRRRRSAVAKVLGGRKLGDDERVVLTSYQGQLPTDWKDQALASYREHLRDWNDDGSNLALNARASIEAIAADHQHIWVLERYARDD